MHTLRLVAAIVLELGISAHAHAQTLPDAQRLFFNARYEAAAAMALELLATDQGRLAAIELRTSALLFQIKAALSGQPDREKALKQCGECADLMTAFMSETARGQAVAHATLRATPGDETALFFLGKLDLNYIWLQVGPLGRRTGWDEYWEARKSLDAVLARNPAHLRARVARAWIDYIVDTKMPRGTRWVLGGGDRKGALRVMHDAARADADVFVHAEALFGLWELEGRERKMTDAIEVARELLHDFPDNRDLAKFLEKHSPNP